MLGLLCGGQQCLLAANMDPCLGAVALLETIVLNTRTVRPQCRILGEHYERPSGVGIAAG